MTQAEWIAVISVFAVVCVLGHVATWLVVRRLARALGLNSFGRDSAGRSALADEITSTVERGSSTDGRIHSHDVSVIVRKVMRVR